jgi:hypothetical protein
VRRAATRPGRSRRRELGVDEELAEQWPVTLLTLQPGGEPGLSDYPGAGPAQRARALFSGQLTAAEVTDHGLEISGDASVLQRVLPQPVAV